LIATIGYGGIMPAQIVSKVKDFYEKELKKVQNNQVNDTQKHSIKNIEHNKKRKINNNQGIVVKGLDNILIRFAKCCNPLPGDEIIGYITKGRGVAIHRSDCPNTNVNDDFFKNRLVDVSWINSVNSKFEAEIQIKSIDRSGIVNDITHIVVIEKVSLNGISARKGKDNIVNVNLLVEVNNIDELNLLMKKIKSIPGVENIYRVVN
jgi:GTP pyrophosphokinase